MLNVLVAARKSICAGCPHQCEDFKDGTIDFANPKEACRVVEWARHWGAVDMIKSVEEMDYRELQDYGHSLQAECGGCHRREL